MIEAVLSKFAERYKDNLDGWDVTLFMCQSSGHLRGSAPADILDTPEADRRILNAADAFLQTGDEF